MIDADRPAFGEAVSALAIVLGKDLDPALLTAYWQFLRDLDLADFKRAVNAAARMLKWFPKPAELRELAVGPRTITAAMQWAHVRRMMDTGDIYCSPDFGPLVNAVLHALGGWKVLCEKTLSELIWYQKDFERLYAEFGTKDLSLLRTEGHVGEFGHRPTWCALPGTVSPPAQIESAGRYQVSDHVRNLAESKAFRWDEEATPEDEPEEV